MEAIIILALLGVICAAGLLCSALSRRLGIANGLLLLIVGMLIAMLAVPVPALLLAGIVVLALAIVLFDSISRLREFDSFASEALRFSIVSMVLTALFVPGLAYFVFGIGDVYLAIILSVLLCGTGSLLPNALKGKFRWAGELLRYESMMVAPLVIIIPSTLLEMRQRSGAVSVITSVSPLLSKFMFGIGAGVIIGILIMRLMKKGCDERLSFFTLVAAVVLVYLSSEFMGGSGVLAVTTMAVLFGSRYFSGTKKASHISSAVLYALGVILFVFIGIVARVSFSPVFMLKAFLLFAICLLLRFFALTIVFRKKLSPREGMAVTLCSPKGTATAAVMLALSLIGGTESMLALLLVLMLYGMAVSAITSSIIGTKGAKLA